MNETTTPSIRGDAFLAGAEAMKKKAASVAADREGRGYSNIEHYIRALDATKLKENL